MVNLGDPQSAVWSATGWDGKVSLMSADMHFARIRRHSTVLGIEVPEDLPERVFDLLEDIEHPGAPNDSPGQAPFLLVMGVRSDGEVFIDPLTIQQWPNRPLSAISLEAPTWNQPVRGTKHGDWRPHREARNLAIENGADIGLLFEDSILIDGDRCAPLLLDHDGVAYHPNHSDGALDSVTIQQIKPALESAGIPVRSAKLTLGMILRASEMIVLGSGMGVQALASIDGRQIGRPQGRLFQAARDSWLVRLDSAWKSIEDLE